MRLICKCFFAVFSEKLDIFPICRKIILVKCSLLIRLLSPREERNFKSVKILHLIIAIPRLGFQKQFCFSCLPDFKIKKLWKNTFLTAVKLEVQHSVLHLIKRKILLSTELFLIQLWMTKPNREALYGFFLLFCTFVCQYIITVVRRAAGCPKISVITRKLFEIPCDLKKTTFLAFSFVSNL